MGTVVCRFLPPRNAFDAQVAHQPGDPLAAGEDIVLAGELELDPRAPGGLQRDPMLLPFPSRSAANSSLLICVPREKASPGAPRARPDSYAAAD
jgi:hypothetical protein